MDRDADVPENMNDASLEDGVVEPLPRRVEESKDMPGAKADTDATMWRLPIPAPETARMERTRAAAGYLMLVGTGTRREGVVDLIGWRGSNVEVMTCMHDCRSRKIRQPVDAQT